MLGVPRCRCPLLCAAVAWKLPSTAARRPPRPPPPLEARWGRLLLRDHLCPGSTVIPSRLTYKGKEFFLHVYGGVLQGKKAVDGQPISAQGGGSLYTRTLCWAPL